MTIEMIDLARQQAALAPLLDEAIGRVMAHRAFVGGPEVGALEAALAARLGAGMQAVACANGTDALQIALRAAGIGPGDGVAVPALTFAATAEAVVLAGATPVFVDTGATSGALCPTSLAAAVAASDAGRLPALRAVLAVDLFSLPADHAAIGAIAARAGLVHLVDAAHSIGTDTAEGPCGTHGLAAATSFYPSKALGCYGDGGAVFTRDASLAARMRAVANHGVLAGQPGHAIVGTNSRLDTLQAAILLAKLTAFDAETAARRRIATRYRQALGAACALPEVPKGCAPVWSYFAIRHPRRDALAAHLATRAIRSVAYYREPLHRQAAFAGAAVVPGGLPGTMDFAAQLLCLPMHPYLTEAEVETVIEAVLDFGA